MRTTRAGPDTTLVIDRLGHTQNSGVDRTEQRPVQGEAASSADWWEERCRQRNREGKLRQDSGGGGSGGET